MLIYSQVFCFDSLDSKRVPKHLILRLAYLLLQLYPLMDYLDLVMKLQLIYHL